MIGRIPVINLNAHQSELFHLRMLLHHVPGPKSFVDIRTIDGTVHPTYQAACKALGLLEDEKEIDRIMEEAGSIRFGSSPRSLGSHPDIHPAIRSSVVFLRTQTIATRRPDASTKSHRTQ